ncbi:matrix-remodeling-associated protein 7-like [Liolophura sinensis]|uniref:matrix-remodeling-associated protein 7-like n=1 Tax=Liolophura sinensis TaxID=3198878 RepID=UPI003158C064
MYIEYVELASICVAIFLTLIALVVSYNYTLRAMEIGKGKKTKEPREANAMMAKNPSDRSDETVTSMHDAEPEPPMDPLEFCEHIHGEVKRVQNKVTTRKIEEKMTAEQIQEEKDMQRKQLEAIFNMMKDQNEKFGVDSMDDVKQQMKLYA